MKSIILTKGKSAIVDDEDYEIILSYGKWDISKNGYAFIKKWMGDKYQHFLMHRVIMFFPDSKKDIDHINRNKLDNRKSNLRITNRTENNLNSKIRKDNTSGIKGVALCRCCKNPKWRAEKCGIYIGHFIDKKEAVKAYNNWSRS